MRTELFRQTLQNVILSNYDNYIMTRLQSTNSPVNNNNNNSNGNNSNGNHTNPDLIDLTHRNALIKKYLNKLNSLLFEYLSSNKDWASSSSSLSSSSSSSTSSSPSLLSSTNIIEPYHQFNVYNNNESRNCLYQWLNQSINCNNLYDDNTLIKNINHESNHLLKLDDNLPLEEATVQFNDENNNNRDFHVDNKYHLDSYRTSFNIPEIYHSKCNPLWSDICCTENYHPELYQNSSIWKQTSSSSSSPSRSLSAAATTTPPPPPITDCSLNTKHTIMNSSFISLNKSNFNEIIDDTKLQLQSTTTTTTTNTIPSISYSPPLNFNEFILDQNMLCPLCHKCFRFEKNLLRHLQKTHATSTGESLLKCKLCNYTTRHYSNMYVHIRTHTGDKPYSCSACGVTFTQGSSLKLHIRSRHNDNIKYFSLIRKPGKNNLTKLWTRILKKDLPKFNTFKSSSSSSSSSSPSSSSYYYYHYYYYYNYWNKWKNIKLNNQIKNQYKNQLNSNSNFIDSIFNNMNHNNNNSLLINDKNIKKIIQSNNWKSINFNLKMNMNKKFNHHHHHKKYINYIQSINNDLKYNDQIIHRNHDPDQYDIDQIKLNEQLIKQENI
ncbi:unnamed protein product [Schistosoma curassoni]|nr:unnamed protein product [Schistosoma curassoni]